MCFFTLLFSSLSNTGFLGFGEGTRVLSTGTTGSSATMPEKEVVKTEQDRLARREHRNEVGDILINVYILW